MYILMVPHKCTILKLWNSLHTSHSAFSISRIVGSIKRQCYVGCWMVNVNKAHRIVHCALCMVTWYMGLGGSWAMEASRVGNPRMWICDAPAWENYHAQMLHLECFFWVFRVFPPLFIYKKKRKDKAEHAKQPKWQNTSKTNQRCVLCAVVFGLGWKQAPVWCGFMCDYYHAFACDRQSSSHNSNVIFDLVIARSVT
jgi:hypothetical protein